MMTFELANSWWMYLLGAFVCLFVLFTSFAFLWRAKREAAKLNLDPSVIRKTVVTATVFSLLPSVSILIGVIALSGTIGIPLPWIRLSVIGALHYEQTAVQSAYQDITMATMTKEQFVTIASVMTLGILSGPLFCLFGFRRYDNKLLAKARKKAPDEETATSEVSPVETETPAEESASDAPVAPAKKKSFGPILFSAAFIALISAFLAEQIAKLKFIGSADALGSYTPTVVAVVSFGVMALVDFLAKRFKIKWIHDFAIGISMLSGMAVAVLIENLF